MTDRNAKADSSGDLHEIKVLQAEIERLREEHRAYQELAKELKAKDEAEIKRLRELTENDGKEIGSYREGTGLRGENRRLRAAIMCYRNTLAGTALVNFEKHFAREALNDE